MLFAILLGPFFFFNITKTRWLQIGTTVFRWTAILFMVSLACARIGSYSSPNPPPSPAPHPAMANFAKLPSLMGVAIYAFMCHHSLPGVLTPVDNKRHIYSWLMLPAYGSILFCYLLLAGTAVAAFENIHDLYTLNFVPSSSSESHPGILILILDYYLSLYPVLALSSTFPIIGTTLSNNMVALIRSIMSRLPASRAVAHPNRIARVQMVMRYCVPLFALIPPILLAMATNDIEFLVGITGAFMGGGIQFVFPVVLVYYSRKALSEHLSHLATVDQPVTDDVLDESTPLVLRTRSEHINPYRSPFYHQAWLWIVIIWMILCMVMVFLNKVHAF